MIGNDWDEILKEEYEKPYFKNLIDFIDKEYKTKTIYPKKSDIFNAFRFTSYKDCKVLILGQDPYHGENQAEGLSFSVKNCVASPPSLQNIFKEMVDDLKIEYPKTHSLVPWSREGVLLLNTVLTVEAHHPASHKGKGWEEFTDAVIKKLNEKQQPIVFILWGSFARSKKNLITNKIHYVIESAHPSPFSAYNGFFGTKPFSRTNTFLKSKGYKEIDWRLDHE